MNNNNKHNNEKTKIKHWHIATKQYKNSTKKTKKHIIMKIFLIFTSCVIIIINANAQESKWFGKGNSYAAVMQTIPKNESAATILMFGGEKPIYNFSEKCSINFWHFEYLDNALGYMYGGLSFGTNFEKGFLSIGAGAGVTSQNFKPIYAFVMIGKFDKFGLFFNSEHNAWPNWHRTWASYNPWENIGIVIGSQAYLGPGFGTKISYKALTLEAMYHIGIEGSYLGSENNADGLTLMLSVGL